MNDVTIKKAGGGLGRRNPSGDMISGLMAMGPALAETTDAQTSKVITTGIALNTVYRFKSMEDVQKTGLNAAYDTANSVVVYEHINEYFRVNPNGDLYFMLVAVVANGADKYADMLDASKANSAKVLLDAAQGAIKQLAVAYNPNTVISDFVPVTNAISKAQILATAEATEHKPLHIVLEGKGFKTTGIQDFDKKKAENVSVMLGQAKSIVDKGGSFADYSAVGTLLGAISAAAVNENIGWVEKFNLFGGSLSVAAIGGKAVAEVSEGTLSTIHEKHGIIFRTHVGKAGIYFNDSPTCTEATSDFAYIENNRTINKAIRQIRPALLPRLNSPVLVDPDKGTLSPEVVKSIENDGRRALEEMVKNDEVSAIDIYIDPKQNILSNSKLEIKFSITPTGTARQIEVTIGFTNPF